MRTSRSHAPVCEGRASAGAKYEKRFFDMTTIATKSTDQMIKEMTIKGHHIDCPFCGRSLLTSENPETSAFGCHFFSKKHAADLPDDPELREKIYALVKRTSRRAKKAERQAEKEAKEARAAAKIAETARLRQKHEVTGAFLDGIVEEMEGLISMMEPYYSQGNGADDAYAKIAEIRAISGEPIEA